MRSARGSVVDPDPNWIRIEEPCESGSVYRKRIHRGGEFFFFKIDNFTMDPDPD